MNVIGIVGWKNCGKTTLVTALIQEMCNRGLTVNSVKDARHGVDVDRPGTDSYRHRQAGAREVVLMCGERFAIMHECRSESEPTLNEILDRLQPVDWVVVEGFKFDTHPKIEVHRQECERKPRYMDDESIIAVAADYKTDFMGPNFDLNDISKITDFILNRT